jgi:O-succinylbenzoic acid--CoA ligase
MERSEMNLCRATQSLMLDGSQLTDSHLEYLVANAPDEAGRIHLQELQQFLSEWRSPSDTMTVLTSGSTGKPKPIQVSKERMMQSAVTTCLRLGLRRGDSALLCMPVRYIAGRMMVVRALVAGLNLLRVTPSSHPFAALDAPVRFAAMVPLQLHGALSIESERRRLFRVERLIIGGGPIDDHLVEQLQTMPSEAYATYGMTETLSHVALRRLNGPSASEYYYPLEGVTLSQSPMDTLIIDAPRVCAAPLVTNDVVRFSPDGGFVVLGRCDNIINSGGIKIQTEEVERLLLKHIHAPFAITSIPDERLGEAVVLLIESKAQVDVDFSTVPRYWRPRHIYTVEKLPQTATGKIDRAACRRMAANQDSCMSMQ